LEAVKEAAWEMFKAGKFKIDVDVKKDGSALMKVILC
jgi:hypothetical protein